MFLFRFFRVRISRRRRKTISHTPAANLTFFFFPLKKKKKNFPPRSCAHELNALFSANAHNFPSIVVRSRTTYTRAETAAVAARIAASPSLAAAAAATAETGGGQRASQHLALAAHVLSVAFAPFPTAALSLYEIEAPSWLAGWAGKWCSATAPATPRNSPAASSNSLSSFDSSSSDERDGGGVVVVKLMALHGYAEGQPACGQGAGLGEPQAGSRGRPARTVYLPIW